MAVLASQFGDLVDLGSGRFANAVVVVEADAVVLANQAGIVVDLGSGRLGNAVVLVDSAGEPLTIGSAGSAAIVPKTADYTATLDDVVILVSATLAPVTIALPTAASAYDAGLGRTYTIKKTDASMNAVTINPNGAELVDGAATLSFTDQYESRTVISNGSAWWVL